MGYITMNHKELEQLKQFSMVKTGLITQAVAAVRLGITDRWVREKIKRFFQQGEAGLVHKSRGKASPHKWSKEKEKLLISLLQGEWQGFGPTFAAEKLEELHGIKISNEVVRQTMIKAGIWKSKQKRSTHRKRRERRSMLGMMVQLDGSPHDWFEGRAGRCTLLVFIDDATSEILWLEFVPSESTESVMRATKNYINKHGIPCVFYTDHGSVFHVNLNNQEGYKKTNWERICKILGVEIIHANSPQAKGRVERCNKTMQDRLIKELRIAGISSIDDANEYLRNSDFIEKHNKKFAIKAAQTGNAHRELSGHNLDNIFCIQETRVLANDFTITYQKKILQLHKQQQAVIRPKEEITVKTSLDRQLSLCIRGIRLNFSEVSLKPSKEKRKEKCIQWRPRKPSEQSRRWVFGLSPLSRVKPAKPAVEAR